MDAQKPKLQSSRELRPPKLTTQGLAVLASACVFGLAIWRADQKDIPTIVKTIVNSGSFALAGWILAGAFLLCGVVVIILMRGIYTNEITRLAQERDNLQNKLIGGESK